MCPLDVTVHARCPLPVARCDIYLLRLGYMPVVHFGSCPLRARCGTYPLAVVVGARWPLSLVPLVVLSGARCAFW